MDPRALGNMLQVFTDLALQPHEPLEQSSWLIEMLQAQLRNGLEGPPFPEIVAIRNKRIILRPVFLLYNYYRVRGTPKECKVPP